MGRTKRQYWIWGRILLAVALILILGSGSSRKAWAAQRPQVSVSTVTTTSVKVGWGKTSGVSGYEMRLYNGKTNKFLRKWEVVKAGTTVQGLSPKTSYKVAVRPFTLKEGKKQYQKASNKIPFTTKKVGKVQIVSAGLASNSRVAVVLGWKNMAGVTGYRVEYRKKGTAKWKYCESVNGKESTVTTKDLDYHTTYQFRVKAYIKIGGKTSFGNYSKVKNVSTKQDEVAQRESFRKQKIQELVAGAKLKSSMKQTEKAARLAYSIAKYVKYGYDKDKYTIQSDGKLNLDGWDDSSYYILKNRKGTSENYANLTNEVFKKAGLSCQMASGVRVQGEANNGMWNLVNLDGLWYVVDLTGVSPKTHKLTFGSYLQNSTNHMPDENTFVNTNYAQAAREDQRQIQALNNSQRFLVRYRYTTNKGKNFKYQQLVKSASVS